MELKTIKIHCSKNNIKLKLSTLLKFYHIIQEAAKLTSLALYFSNLKNLQLRLWKDGTIIIRISNLLSRQTQWLVQQIWRPLQIMKHQINSTTRLFLQQTLSTIMPSLSTLKKLLRLLSIWHNRVTHLATVISINRKSHGRLVAPKHREARMDHHHQERCRQKWQGDFSKTLRR